MARKSIRIAVILAVAALLIGLALMLAPQDAYADSYPQPKNIYIDIDYNSGLHFDTNKLSYDCDTHTFTTTGRDIWYDPDTGILNLRNYRGGSIRVDNSYGCTLSIRIDDENTITTTNQYAIRAFGVDLNIFSSGVNYDPMDPNVLNIVHDFHNSASAGAAITNCNGPNETPHNIVIEQYVTLNIDSYSARTDSGIRSSGLVQIAGHADVDINSRFAAERAYSGLHSQAIWAVDGVQIYTDQRVNLSVAARDGWAGEYPCYAVYIEGGQFFVSSSCRSVYISLSSVGANAKICNVSIPNMSGSIFNDFSESSATYSVRMIHNKSYPYTEWLPLNGFFFPDPSFRDLVREIAGDKTERNAQIDDLGAVREIRLNNYADSEKYRQAYSLKGIENFNHLETLVWPLGYIKELDLPYDYPKLTEIDLYGNYLENLDLSRQTELTHLTCGNNLLTELDVSKCSNLQYLLCNNDTEDYYHEIGYYSDPYCSNFNSIRELDVSMCHELKWLKCYGNEMKSLQLGTNSNLGVLYCFNYNQPLEVLSLIGCPTLIETYLYYDERDYMTDPDYVYYDKYYEDKAGTMGIDHGTKVITSAPAKYATLKTAYLTLEGKISLNFKVQTTGSGMTAKLYYQKNGYELVKTIPLNNSVWHSEDGGYYLVTYDQIPAKEMMLNLMIKVYDSAGNPVMLKTSSNWWTAYKYKVADWCNNKIKSSSNAKEVKLAKAMLNYGHYTQLALGYNDGLNGRPNKLANPNGYLSSEMNAVSPVAAYSRITDGGKELGAKSFVLVLESDTIIKLLLSRSVNVNIDGVPVTLAPETDANGNSVWAAYSSGVAAKRLHERRAFALTEGSNSATMYYGCLSWANSKLENGSENDKDLARAMYLYNAAAREYFNY